MSETIKLIAGKLRYPVQMLRAEGRLFFKFDFNKKLMAEIKAMAGSVKAQRIALFQRDEIVQDIQCQLEFHDCRSYCH